ncbi:hypothetical protein [Fundidesulfovibrio putealis]|uniref:hypothetical protein n=1 Tax=Fundidesulfovibrio putealis TaxID=270496 RepID=UPI00041441E8|nr:hypothetical protein [Fundidesulfovibrio putealis]
MLNWEFYTGSTRAKKAAELVMTISKGGIIYLGKGPLEQFGISPGYIMMGISKEAGTIGFKMVDKSAPGAFELKAVMSDGEMTACNASISSFLRRHGLKFSAVTKFALHEDQASGVYYAYLDSGVAASRKQKSTASDEVKKVLDASAASPESDNEGAEEVGA